MTKITSMDGSISIENYENGSVHLFVKHGGTVIEGKELKSLVNRALEETKVDERDEGCEKCVNYGIKCGDCFMRSYLKEE